MPTEKRDPQSGAKIFVPTPTERATVQQARELKKQLAEVEAMKQELRSLIEQYKK
jgi:hypothetical protein